MARRKDPPTEEPAPVAEGGPEAVSDVPPVPEAVAVPPQAPEPDLPPEPPAHDPVTPPSHPRRSGFLGTVAGGALAAVAGFGLSHFNVFDLTATDPSEALAALDARLTEAVSGAETRSQADEAAVAALQGDLAALADRVAVLESQPAPEPPDLSRLDALDQRLAVIEALPDDGGASTAALAAKLADLERRLAAQPPGVDRAEVDAALARLAAAEAEAAARAEEAAAAAAAADRAVKREALKTAILSGASFETELSALDDPALSQALAPSAGGVATLGALQAEFPEAARAVLDLARQGSQAEGWGARLLDFLAAQTGARSVTPREGDAPDAILSRAEAALGVGRLTDALNELAALDPALRSPLDGWIARAEARVAAIAAVEEP